MTNNNGDPVPLSVDHDHVTGAVRGLLCRRCNTGLGNFDDNIKIVQSALTYLKEVYSIRTQK